MILQSTRKVEKTKSEISKHRNSETEEEEFKISQVINKLASTEENKGKCETFGKFIATELKTLNQKTFLLAIWM